MCHFLSGKVDNNGVLYFSTLWQHEGIDQFWSLSPDQAREFEWVGEDSDSLEVRVTQEEIDAGRGVDYWKAQILGQFKTRSELIKALGKKHKNIKFNIEHKASYGNTALIFASRYGHKEIVQSLLKARANIDHKDSDGWTALMSASSNGHKEVVQSLLKAGAKE